MENLGAFPSLEKILQKLIQFNTTNPPGNEKECILYIKSLLEGAGFNVQLYAKDENRLNLVARLHGKGEAPPLLLYGHVDVVTTAGQKWTYPPFEGKIIDGYIWGRGALDMKGGIAMMISVMLRLKAEKIIPAGDVVFMALSDEENNGAFGALYMVEEHPDLFTGIKYAMGEFGGSSVRIAGKRFYPIQVSEKQFCSIGLTVRGPGGHGAAIVSGNAVGKTAEVLNRITKKRMPVHITPPIKMMIGDMASQVGFPTGNFFQMLLNPKLTDLLLGQLGEIGQTFLPMFHNTVNATIIQGGEKMNVIPCDINLTLDGRILPGLSTDQMVAELRELIGFNEEDVEIKVLYYEKGPENVDMGLFDHLANVLRNLDPEGIPIPLLLPYVTDGRHLAKLGIQSYGFIPMKLPDGFEFFKLAHAEDERLPLEAIYFGAEGIYQAIVNY